ncbi:MAG: hypothetical protein D6723_07450 [Acidobacteria bacterium]|nr:MAG: hypothetical protein D6723_07450 [Acidobacteriota bacterium]
MVVEVKLPPHFLETLPDPTGARRFIERLQREHPTLARRAVERPTWVANLLVLAAHSPFLAEIMLRHPEYVEWLGSERDLKRMKSKEELLEDLARFAAIHSTLSESAILSRFKHREWLRIYLRDCLKLATLSETTLELSNLADVVLQHALWHSYQRLINQYGTPEVRDARGRIQPAAFAIVALGKLGSQELNYASDIDLLYLYSQSGTTSTGQLTNKEFFVKLAEHITEVVGGTGEEGAVYRIDLRLRPHGRAGDIAISLNEAIAYYRRIAQPWERQALIRARCAAGSEALVQQFMTAVRDDIYPLRPSPQLLEEIRAVKEKIDRETSRRHRGIHVKLGRGGIREIEFIVQALQLYYGGREPWIRVGPILIGLQRLADKGMISETDHARLSEAYTFLRTVEHRLQMEQGLRTHVVPLDATRLDLLAKRLGYLTEARPGRAFLDDVQRHMAHVEALFESLFRGGRRSRVRRWTPPHDELEWRRVALTEALDQLVAAFGASESARTALDARVPVALGATLNPGRATKNFIAFAQSLNHALAEEPPLARMGPVSDEAFLDIVEKLVRFFGVSQFFSQILLSHPRLVSQLLKTTEERMERTVEAYRRRLDVAVTDLPADLLPRMNALRRRWHEELLHIGYRDITGMASLRETNVAQTALARASLMVASELAFRELEGKFGALIAPPRYVILGLGRLGHNGMDYNSDLDILVVYDENQGSPLPGLGAQEAYGMFVQRLVHILSAITREGMLYTVDLRLRPDGHSGPLAHSGAAFLDYVRQRAAIWEHLAYLKAYPVAGDPTFAEMMYRQLQAHILHAHRSHFGELARQIREIRQRLEREKARGVERRNIKYGTGGMLDVYFATRYLQLKHHIPDPPERGTLPLIDHLLDCGALDAEQHRVLFDGYAFLRRTDHCLRLLFDRPKNTLPANRERLNDLVRLFGSDSIEQWQRAYESHTTNIRRVYEHILAAAS